MYSLKTLVILAFGALTFATPIDSPLERRQCIDYCGSTCYYQSDINAAVTQGCNYHKKGQTVGDNDYPHSENNYEGFDFPDPGPYYEFPILSSYKVYTGGSPGPDRVVFTGSCAFEDLVTHTGASGNDFVECRGV